MFIYFRLSGHTTSSGGHYQMSVMAGDRMPETWRTSSRYRGGGLREASHWSGRLTLASDWLLQWSGQWMLMKGVKTKDALLRYYVTQCYIEPIRVASDQCQWNKTEKNVMRWDSIITRSRGGRWPGDGERLVYWSFYVSVTSQDSRGSTGKGIIQKNNLWRMSAGAVKPGVNSY